MDHKKISLQAQFTIIFFFLIAGMILCFVLVNSVFLDDFYRDSRVTALKKCYESLTRAVEEGTISSDAFDVDIPVEKVVPENFESAKAIFELIRSLQG